MTDSTGDRFKAEILDVSKGCPHGAAFDPRDVEAPIVLQSGDRDRRVERVREVLFEKAEVLGSGWSRSSQRLKSPLTADPLGPVRTALDARQSEPAAFVISETGRGNLGPPYLLPRIFVDGVVVGAVESCRDCTGDPLARLPVASAGLD